MPQIANLPDLRNQLSFFGGERDNSEELKFGVCKVSIPRDHQMDTWNLHLYGDLNFEKTQKNMLFY